MRLPLHYPEYFQRSHMVLAALQSIGILENLEDVSGEALGDLTADG